LADIGPRGWTDAAASGWFVLWLGVNADRLSGGGNMMFAGLFGAFCAYRGVRDGDQSLIFDDRHLRSD
jgi:hypothetical protein